MGMRFFDRLIESFGSKNIKYKEALRTEAIHNVERLNQAYDTKIKLKFNMNCVENSYPDFKPQQIRQQFFGTYFKPLDLAITVMINDKSYATHFREQFEFLEIVPGQGSEASFLFNDGTLRIRKSFDPRLAISEGGIESAASEIVSVFRSNLIVFD